MATFDSIDREWRAEDPLLPEITVIADSPAEAEHDLALLKAAKVLDNTLKALVPR